MLEYLNLGFYSDSKCPPLPLETGPGPTELIGKPHCGPDEGQIAGFFGEVPVNQLITGKSLASNIRLSAGYEINSNEPWLKFILDGKILFIAKRPYRYYVRFTEIPVNAREGAHLINIASHQYKVRLIKGLNPFLSTPFQEGYDTESTWYSEWNRLMYPVTTGRTKSSQLLPNWTNYTESSLGMRTYEPGESTWCQEVHPGNGTYRILRGTFVTEIRSYLSSTVNDSRGWRPVLELVND